jgi:transposase-like protein
MGKHYPEELKIKVVKDYLSGSRHCEVIRKYGIERTRLPIWVKQYQETGRCEDRTGRKASGRPQKVDPETMTKDEYIRYLEMENDILKRLSSLNSSRQK